MGEKYSPKVGDRVRVVLEGEVIETPAYVGDFKVADGAGYTWVQPQFPHVVSIEKIEPPVEFFKPGDVVRRRFSRYKPGLQFLIVDSGWVSFGGGWASGDGVYIEDRGRRFTSDEYEKVNLG